MTTARLVIVIEVDIDPTRWDPHLAADELLHEDLPSFTEGGGFTLRRKVDHEDNVLECVFLSAEWER